MGTHGKTSGQHDPYMSPVLKQMLARYNSLLSEFETMPIRLPNHAPEMEEARTLFQRISAMIRTSTVPEIRDIYSAVKERHAAYFREPRLLQGSEARRERRARAAGITPQAAAEREAARAAQRERTAARIEADLARREAARAEREAARPAREDARRAKRNEYSREWQRTHYTPAASKPSENPSPPTPRPNPAAERAASAATSRAQAAEEHANTLRAAMAQAREAARLSRTPTERDAHLAEAAALQARLLKLLEG